MPTRSPRAVAGFAMLSLGFFDGILGVAWLAAHETLRTPIESLGLVLFAVGTGSAIGSAVAPIFTKRWGHLQALSATLLLQLVCMVLLGLSDSLLIFCTLYGLRGLANGVAHTSLNAFFAPRISSRHLMNVHGGWGIGTATAGLVAGGLLALGWGWSLVYWLGALLTGFSALLVRLSGTNFHRLPEQTDAHGPSGGALAPAVLLLLIGGGLYVGLEQGVGNWLSSLLVNTRGATVSEAGVATAIFWGSLTLGRFVLTRIPGSEEQVLMMTSALLVVSLALTPWGPIEWQWTLFGVAGLAMAPVAPFALNVVTRRVSPAVRDRVMSLQIFGFSVGAGLIPAVYGLVGGQIGLAAINGAFVVSAFLLLLIFWATIGPRRQGVE